MKLQINANGSWKNIVVFDAERAPMVEDAAASLARALGRANLAIVDDDGTRRYLTDLGVFRALRGCDGL